MSLSISRPVSNLAHRHMQEQLTYKLIVLMTFPLFLAATFFAAMLPRRLGAEASKSNRWSLLQQARTASNSTIPFVFMG